MNKNTAIGLISLILGIFVIGFPMAGVYLTSIIDGLALLIISIWAVIHSLREWEIDKRTGISYIVLGLIGLIIALGIIGNIAAYSILVGFSFYIIGLFLIVIGFLVIYSDKDRSRYLGFLGVLLGIFTIFLGFLSFDPINLAIIIGFWLILFGMTEILVIGRD
ncbi:DUF308 domain-containing protein [Methanobacterium alcaliphilum]|uniref:DUF308 domain-containing protein n=1 Tax=Methanobacterium alcaliphilum TaxID=392018 RepID=UPI00200A015E|nr:DUF308 domain-containing protein [Methanobacterium alcaliphilum]MCK9151560.1 DUF308 domain-containing protein [Methanobacterium alcaliphilum]